MTTKITGSGGKVKKLHCVRVDGDMQPVKGSDFELKADLVLLAMGFVHPVHDGMVDELKLEKDERGNVKATEEDYQTVAQKDIRGRRYAPWPIACRMGDPRGPPGRARDRRIPDGRIGPTALTPPHSANLTKINLQGSLLARLGATLLRDHSWKGD